MKLSNKVVAIIFGIVVGLVAYFITGAVINYSSHDYAQCRRFNDSLVTECKRDKTEDYCLKKVYWSCSLF